MMNRGCDCEFYARHEQLALELDHLNRSLAEQSFEYTPSLRL